MLLCKFQMVTFREVGKRHCVYFLAFVLVIAASKHTWTLFLLLSTLLAGIRWHHGTPAAFVGLVCIATPVATGFVVKLSNHTWWYADPIESLGVPPWLFPLHGLMAHWVLDAYFVVTLSEVRKITLP